MPRSILAVESSISMSLCVSVVGGRPKEIKQIMQFFVDDLVVGLAMLSYNNQKWKDYSLLGKRRMKFWLRSQNEMQVIYLK